ncbi:recombinase family protein [Kitasatospora sp. RB6PN24]|uniref:recombinase family protein n=1 Tax=Kitasatospora humi TaxID=2893891 RepID=UPI001E622851|nr:recombinase family protein [Kitasatospora humi]MCC9310433.1 recombinase family protein [Kitasatospora humi]
MRISDDPTEAEKGVTRQREDVEALAARLGWTIAKVYTENDTSAYKRSRIRKPDGRSVWRVIRPEFRQMLQDYEDGVIDAIIVYDLDRLARQPRDLEDLIDLVDHFKRRRVRAAGGPCALAGHAAWRPVPAARRAAVRTPPPAAPEARRHRTATSTQHAIHAHTEPIPQTPSQQATTHQGHPPCCCGRPSRPNHPAPTACSADPAPLPSPRFTTQRPDHPQSG